MSKAQRERAQSVGSRLAGAVLSPAEEPVANVDESPAPKRRVNFHLNPEADSMVSAIASRFKGAGLKMVSNSALVEVAIRELNERSDDEIRALFRKHPTSLAYPLPERTKP